MMCTADEHGPRSHLNRPSLYTVAGGLILTNLIGYFHVRWLAPFTRRFPKDIYFLGITIESNIVVASQ